jgi:hypothetical protein
MFLRVMLYLIDAMRDRIQVALLLESPLFCTCSIHPWCMYVYLVALGQLPH